MLYIFIFVIVLLLYVVIVYNYVIKANNKVKDAFAVMDVYLKKRWDLIPSIVETVKGYANHENQTLKEVIELRNNNYDSLNENDKIDKNVSLASKLERLMILAESYPELKASDNFKKLNDSLIEVENEIANARKYYNATIRDYNNLIQVFPNNVVAFLFRVKPKEMFKTVDLEKENVKIDL